MIYSTLDTLIDKIGTACGSDIKELGRYKGEFEENGEWNPVFPAVLVNISKAEPILETHTSIIGFSITANIYIVVKNDITDNRTFLDNFLNILDGFGLSFPESISGVTKFTTESVNLHGYFHGVDVYRAEVTIIKKL